MNDEFVFQYGSKSIRVYARSGGVTSSPYPARPVNARWFYEVDGQELPGPDRDASPDEDLALLKLWVRMDYKKRRDPLEPGRGHYQFKPDLVAMVPQEEWSREWVNLGRDGRVFEGEPDGDAVRLFPPAGAVAGSESILVRPIDLYRAEPEDSWAK